MVAGAVAGTRLGARFSGDVRSLLKRHGVPCEGAKDLRRLGEFLFTDAAFRGDLFALCSSISHMADEDLTADELLGVVAESYGPGTNVPEELRAEFLAAYQGWSARELAVELPERSVAEVRTVQEPSPTARMAEVDETLQRLSVSSLELKMFLADVKQRVSEIDPELEHLEQMVEQMKAGASASDRVSGPAVVVADRSATVKRLRIAVIGLAAALLVAVSCGAWLARGYWDTSTSAVRIVDGSRGQTQGKPGAGTAAPVAREVVGAKTSASAHAGRPIARTPTAASAGSRRVSELPAVRTQAPAVLKPTPVGHTPAPIVRVDPGAKARPTGPVFVPSSTMLGYALATPKPLFPAVSVPDDKEGRVEVQATISAEGEVVATQVISGPVVFREAADRAMQRWRFRPYVVDGRAVEVNTTVAFVFRSQPAT